MGSNPLRQSVNSEAISARANRKAQDAFKSSAVGNDPAQLRWANSFLKRCGSKHRVVADLNGLFRVKWGNGLISDIVNLSRAVDAALEAIS
jgi:hypothetical protein